MKYFLLFLFFFNLSYSQDDAWVYFTDKPSSATFLSNPLLMLSQRALERRSNQNIALDIKDVPIESSYYDQIKQSPGIIIMAKSKWLNALHVRGQLSDIQSLESLPIVDHIKYANHSLNSRVVPDGVLNKQQDNQQAKFEFETTFYDYGSSANQIQMLNAHSLHQVDFKGQGKVVAVLDSGFTGVDQVAAFAHLRDNDLILGGYNFPDRNDNFYSRDSHGTMVLSTMGGVSESKLIGTAPEASYYLFITEDIHHENPVEESYWVEAVELSDSLGVDLINTSLGYFDYDNPAYSYTYEQLNGTTAFASQAADIAFDKGMICVTSAGNSGSTSNPHIGVPAESIKTIAVGAVDLNENRVSFSSIGPTADARIKPDLCAKGYQAVVCEPSGAIVQANGTSFSSPILAGAITSFWSSSPNLTNQQVVDYVKASADQFTNPDHLKGYGIPDFKRLLNDLQGYFPEGMNTIIYYKPIDNQINIILPNKVTDAEFKLFDASGKLVELFQVSTMKWCFQLSPHAKGVYFYDLSGDNLKLQGKLLIR